jgi:HSP20 family protein
VFGSVMFPSSGYEELRREMDRVFDAFGAGRARWPYARAAYPAVNVWDAGDMLCVEAEVPGVAKEQLEILAVGNELTVKGQRRPLVGEKQTYHRRERGMGEFTRSITLPVEIDANKVEAGLENGVLLLRLPKAESAKPKQITVKGG